MPSGCRGTVLPILDITIPNEPQFLDALAVLYSVMPLFIGVLIVIGLIVRRRITLLLATVLFAVSFLVFEFVVKYAIPSDRPFGTCATTPGMGPAPAIVAFAFLSWGLFESAFHQPQLLRLTKLGYLLAAITLLAPVPAGRKRLKDHTNLQLGLGVVIGMILGLTWFMLLHFLIGRRLDKIFGPDTGLGKIFTLDYFIDLEEESPSSDEGPDEELNPRTSFRRLSQFSIQSGSPPISPAATPLSAAGRGVEEFTPRSQPGEPSLSREDAPFGDDLESVGSTSLRN